MPEKCPSCGSKHLIRCGFGTQKVEQELSVLMPDARVLRMDADTTSTKQSYENLLNEFRERGDVLLGTQMVTKGHDFPLVTLVGIVDADIGLHQSDFRASERCFQLVTQVAGRAGRSEFEGEVVLQSYKPNHYVYRFARNYDYEGFFSKEIEVRKTTHFPPFASIIRVLISSENDELALESTGEIYKEILKIKDKFFSEFIFCKAVACPVKRIQTKYRYEVIIRVKNEKYDDIIQEIYKSVDSVKRKSVITFVETNPQNLS